MRKEYDFTNAMPNPYAKKLRKQVAVKIDAPIVDYFKKQASALGTTYQNLIGHYLANCIANKTKRVGLQVCDSEKPKWKV